MPGKSGDDQSKDSSLGDPRAEDSIPKEDTISVEDWEEKKKEHIRNVSLKYSEEGSIEVSGDFHITAEDHYKKRDFSTKRNRILHLLAVLSSLSLGIMLLLDISSAFSISEFVYFRLTTTIIAVFSILVFYYDILKKRSGSE